MRKVRNKKRKNERDERRNERQKKKRTRERERNKADECGKETTTTVSRFGARWPRAVKSVQIDTNRMPSEVSRGEVSHRHAHPVKELIKMKRKTAELQA